MSEVRILVIDDEPNVLSSLQRLLRRHAIVEGARTVVETYASPREAMEAARERPMDAVVCDYRMPELDGVELLRRLKELQPYAGRVLLSGLRDFETVLQAINVAQVGRMVLKPWDDLQLVAAVREVVEIRRLQLENARLADQVRAQQGRLSTQEAELRRLESMWPGITKVEWGSDGSIVISDVDIR